MVLGMFHQSGEVERLREDAAFWKRELDSAIAERNQWQQRGVTADRDVAILKRELMSTKQEYAELRRAVAKAFPDLAASVRSSAEAGSQAAAGSAESAVARLAHHKEMYAKLYEAAKGLQAQLGASKAQAREMEARSGLLTERVEALRQENDLLRHQNQLLRASEATFEREASLLREELKKQAGINDLTADETTKLLGDMSKLAQHSAQLSADLRGKDELIALLRGQLSEFMMQGGGGGGDADSLHASVASHAGLPPRHPSSSVSFGPLGGGGGGGGHQHSSRYAGTAPSLPPSEAMSLADEDMVLMHSPLTKAAPSTPLRSKSPGDETPPHDTLAGFSPRKLDADLSDGGPGGNADDDVAVPTPMLVARVAALVADSEASAPATPLTVDPIDQSTPLAASPDAMPASPLPLDGPLPCPGSPDTSAARVKAVAADADADADSPPVTPPVAPPPPIGQLDRVIFSDQVVQPEGAASRVVAAAVAAGAAAADAPSPAASQRAAAAADIEPQLMASLQSLPRLPQAAKKTAEPVPNSADRTDDEAEGGQEAAEAPAKAAAAAAGTPCKQAAPPAPVAAAADGGSGTPSAASVAAKVRRFSFIQPAAGTTPPPAADVAAVVPKPRRLSMLLPAADDNVKPAALPPQAHAAAPAVTSLAVEQAATAAAPPSSALAPPASTRAAAPAPASAPGPAAAAAAAAAAEPTTPDAPVPPPASAAAPAAPPAPVAPPPAAAAAAAAVADALKPAAAAAAPPAPGKLAGGVLDFAAKFAAANAAKTTAAPPLAPPPGGLNKIAAIRAQFENTKP